MNIDKSGERVRQMFDEISPRYDFLNHLLSGGTDFYWRWQTVRRVPPNGVGPILDVCTGTGDLALSYWKKSRGRSLVVGTDFAHDMLQLANQKSANHQQRMSARVPPTVFLEADTQSLPLSDDQFQIVSVAFGLRNVADTERGLREMTRVCKPGGRVVVLEFSMPQNRMIRSVYRWYFRHVLPRIGQLVSRSHHAAYNYLPESVGEFPQGDEFAAMMRDCGLDPVTWWPLSFGIATLYCGQKPV